MSRTHVQRISGATFRRLTRRPGRLSAGLRLGVVALALDGGASATAAEPNAGAVARQHFEAWVDREALATGGAVSALTEVELDGEPGAEMVARVCHHDGWAETVLVERGGHRWRVPHESWGHARLCGATGAPSWRRDIDELVLADVGPGMMSRQNLAIVDDRVVVASESTAHLEAASDVRWDIATKKEQGKQARIIRVRQNNAAVPESGPTFVLAGREHWAGLNDADIRAVAERRDNGSVILRIEFRDDEPRLGLDGDRIELWWTGAHDGVRRGLEIRTDASGALRSIPRGAQTEPLSVHGGIHHLEVMLDWRLLSPDFGRSLRLSVLARDVDGDGKSTVATSQYNGGVASLGELRYFPGGGDYPVAGHRVANASALDTLPSPPVAAR